MGGEGGVDRFVVDFVAHVGEEGAAGFEEVDEGDGFFQMRVAGVRGGAEGVEDEEVEVLEEGEGFGGDVAHVREVGGGAEAVAGDALAAVDDGNALEGGAEEGDAGPGGVMVEAVEGDAGAGGVTIFCRGRCS